MAELAKTQKEREEGERYRRERDPPPHMFATDQLTLSSCELA